MVGLRLANDGLAQDVHGDVPGRRLRPAERVGPSGTLRRDPDLPVGSATLVESVTVRWPAGLTERFSNLAVDRTYSLKEGAGLQK